MIKLLYKNKNISSFKFINNYKRKNNIEKIGHTGTLDPLATGLLLVATNDDTKLIEYIKADRKEYIVEAKFGILTTSLDLGSDIIQTAKFDVKKNSLQSVLDSFIGVQYQTPPMVSAKKINGERAYKIARESRVATLTPVKINIKKLELLEYDGENFKIKTTVSKGTYIRQLVIDISRKLNTIATVTSLERTGISGLSLCDLKKEINIKSILTIDVCNIKSLANKEVIDLLNGKKIDQIFKDTTLLIYQNKPLAIINERQPIKVFPNNLKYFL